jgi:ribosome maturation factor RimP
LDTGRIESTIEGLGFEVVTLDRAGGRQRPILRIRIDRPDSEPGRSSVTVEDCARVTRAVRAVVEEEEGAAGNWVLEVSSPGVERPLTKARDFDRFRGQRVRVRGYGPLHGRSKELEGTLLGRLEDDPGTFSLDLGGERVEIALDALAGARLVYSWDTAGKAASPSRRER